MLSHPDPNLPFDVHVDASNVGLGAVLVQAGRPVAFASRTLTSTEQNCSATEKECLAVVWALDYFHPYVYGATVTVYSEHAALKWIMSRQAPRGRIARWTMTLLQYDFAIVHRHGVENKDADALSRLQQNPHQVQAVITQETLRYWQEVDPAIKAIKANIKAPYQLIDGVVFYGDDKPVAVIPPELRHTYMAAVHTHVTGGHLGKDKTLEKAREYAWWPTLVKDVTEYVQSCESCQHFKAPTKKFGEMQPIAVGKAGDLWATDVAVLPESTRGNRYLLVCMEYLTKWVITAALSTFDGNAIANVLLFQVVLIHGIPKRILTDNGTNFVSEAMNLVCDRLGIARTTTSVEHPQTDGLVERMNRTVKTSLAIYVEKGPRLWDLYLPFVTFGINTARLASTGVSPFGALYGRQASLPPTAQLEPPAKSGHTTKSWIQYLNHYLPIIHDTIRNKIEEAQQRQNIIMIVSDSRSQNSKWAIKC